jgi:hypothetical protein
MVWLEALVPVGPGAGVLCQHHADAMRLPKGWWLQDRREDEQLFASAPAPPPSPPVVPGRTTVAPYRPRRPRRPRAEPALLPIDRVPAAGTAVDREALEPVWTPAFDAGDDLGGLLDAKTPLLSRAFRRDGSPRAEG